MDRENHPSPVSRLRGRSQHFTWHGLAIGMACASLNPAEMLSNRLWGGLQGVGGVLEMPGAGVWCVVPEPTMASPDLANRIGLSLDIVRAMHRQVLRGAARVLADRRRRRADSRHSRTYSAAPGASTRAAVRQRLRIHALRCPDRDDCGEGNLS